VYKAKAAYCELHDALAAAVARTARLEDDATGLDRELAEGVTTLEEARAAARNSLTEEEEEELDRLRRECDVAVAEAELAGEREQSTSMDVYEQTRARNAAKKRLEEVELEHERAMAPALASARAEVSELAEDVRSEKTRMEDLHKAKADAVARVGELQTKASQISNERERVQTELDSIAPLPLKIKRECDVINEQIKALRTQEPALNKKFAALDESELRQSETVRGRTEEHAHAAGTLERASIAMEQKTRTADEFSKDLEKETSERERLVNEKLELEQRAAALDAEKKALADRVARRRKELEQTERKTGKMAMETKHVADVVPQFETEVSQLRLDVKTTTRVAAERSAAIEAIRADIDAEMKAYITEESAGKTKGTAFETVYAEVAALEDIIKHLKKEEADRNKVERDVRTQVERLIKTTMLKREKHREQTELANGLDNELDDLKKQTKENERRHTALVSLFHEVQSQRNKFAQLIEAGKQTKAETGEKLRVLANEIDILRGESGDKEIKLVHAHAQLTSAMTARDVLRQDINKRAMTFREGRDKIDEQMNEMEGLHTVADQGRKNQIRLTLKFEHETQRRDHAGLMLVERNDEVAAMHERVNLQVEVGRRGEIELQNREDEIRAFAAEIRKHELSVEANASLASGVPGLNAEIERLRKELIVERRRVARLSAKAETPENADRWRVLQGKDPGADELRAKLKDLKLAIEDKEDEIEENVLMLQELDSLVQRMTSEAASGRAESLELARTINDLVTKIQSTGDETKSTVSELALCQATSERLQLEAETLKRRLVEARERVARGEAPDDEAEKRWARELAGEAFVDDEDDDRPGADARPNAYVPTDEKSMGVPRPYGKFAPFKPTDVTGQLRHYRKPTVADVDAP
jgi:chromosome segregation ATPase